MPAGEDTPPAAPTPLLDAAIQRVEAVTRAQRDSLQTRAASRTQPAPAVPPGVVAPVLDTSDPSGALLSEAAREATATASLPDRDGPGAAKLAESAPLAVVATLVEPAAAPGSAAPSVPSAGDPPAPVPAPSSTLDGKDPSSPPVPDRQVPNDEPPKPCRGAKPRETQDEPPPAPGEEGPTPDEEGLAPATAGAERPPLLEITELRLCRKISGFGRFEPLDPTAIKAGQRLLLYWEMTGLEYQAQGDAFRSRLAAHLELRPDGDASIVWEQSPGIAEDLCNHRRRDCYANCRIELPKTLEPGRYRLRLIQTDLIADRTSSKEVPITIAP